MALYELAVCYLNWGVPIVTINVNFTAIKAKSYTQLNLVPVTKALAPANNFVAARNKQRKLHSIIFKTAFLYINACCCVP